MKQIFSLSSTTSLTQYTQAGIALHDHRAFFIAGTRNRRAQAGALLPAHRVPLKLAAPADTATHTTHGTLRVTVPTN